MTFGEGSFEFEMLGQLLCGIATLEAKPDIAAFFREIGVKGARNSAVACPVRNFLYDNIGLSRSTIRELVVGTRAIQLTLAPEQEGYVSRRLVLDTPARIGTFAEEFDRGSHLDLVVEGN